MRAAATAPAWPSPARGRRLRPETHHLPIGYSEEEFGTSRRWIGASLLTLAVLGAAIALAVLRV